MGRNAKVEFGDFQTPYGLARSVCDLLRQLGVSPRSIVEPTCGKGSFLQAATDMFPAARLLGFEINPDYVAQANDVVQATIRCRNFFDMDWPETLAGLQDPVLIVGNPPWVTNSAMGSIRGGNLPVKSNFRRLNGLDALTGKSNFDISEWMLSHLLESLSGKDAVLAMLCKTAVARKVLHNAWSRNLHLGTASVFRIDAAAHFGVSVDACLLVCVVRPGGRNRECAVYRDLEQTGTADSVYAYRDGRLVADLDAFDTYGYLYGRSPLKWRSGIKHDCSPIIELRPRGDNTFENGLGDIVRLESTHLYPMFKSSELTKPRPIPSRYMLVTQRTIGEDTSPIQYEAPQTWSYLQSNADRLDRRASSIYRNRPRFSIFGVGPYSFAPWKVAISGFYKRLDFRSIGPTDGKPVMLDDTCYFLPCETRHDATVLAKLLNSDAANGFLRSAIFWDTKRPITAQALTNLNLSRLADEARVRLPEWRPMSDTPPLFGS